MELIVTFGCLILIFNECLLFILKVCSRLQKTHILRVRSLQDHLMFTIFCFTTTLPPFIHLLGPRIGIEVIPLEKYKKHHLFEEPNDLAIKNVILSCIQYPLEQYNLSVPSSKSLWGKRSGIKKNNKWIWSRPKWKWHKKSLKRPIIKGESMMYNINRRKSRN